jgi:hypothetical protein
MRSDGGIRGSDGLVSAKHLLVHFRIRKRRNGRWRYRKPVDHARAFSPSDYHGLADCIIDPIRRYHPS